jgi:DNA repair protein RadC
MEKYVSISSIKSWAEDDRPREKLLSKGRSALSDAELLAILFGSGTISLSAVEMARQILHSVNNDLHSLSKLSINDLKKFKGIGEAKAISLIAALELGRRRKELSTTERLVIKSSNSAFVLMEEHLLDLPHEEFWVILLNRANAVIKKELISRGGISGTVADIRLILKTAIENLASSIILLHNHPSGQLKPSKEDLDLTKKIIEGAKLLDISVFDHIIFCQKDYFSFADNNLL